MAVLTNIFPATRPSGYLDLEVDGQSLGAVPQRVADQLGLRVGMTLTDEAVAELRASARMGEALVIANRFLAHRPRTAGEVRVRLRRAQLEPEIIDAALAELEHQGLLDDRRFAALWVENRTAFSPRSARVLEQELRRKGVNREVIDQTFAGAEMGDEAGLALDAGRKRLRSMFALDEETFRRRMAGYLTRRGFDYRATRAAVDQLWVERLADT